MSKKLLMRTLWTLVWVSMLGLTYFLASGLSNLLDRSPSSEVRMGEVVASQPTQQVPTSQPTSMASGVPDAGPPATWEPTTGWDELMGEWGDTSGKPLPVVKVAKPNPKRKFRAERPSHNVKFRIPTSAGMYEGGCDVYAGSGLAFCRIHDPTRPKTYVGGEQVKGVITAELLGKRLRLTLPGGMQTELSRVSSR